MRLLVLLYLCLTAVRAQSAGPLKPNEPDRLTTSTDSVGPLRFVAVHGRRSVIMGYPQAGLEVWAYPFQILSGYQVGFRPSGATAEIDGRLLLRRIDYRPDSVTRVYIGPDYLVRERLFVPLNRAATIISYEVEGVRPVDIEIHFRSVLDLMWPGAVGAQYTRWDARLPGYVIAAPVPAVSAMIGSAEIITHDDTVNSTVRATDKLSFSIRPHTESGGASKATVYIALNETGDQDTGVDRAVVQGVDPGVGDIGVANPGFADASTTLHSLQAHLHLMEAEAAAHYVELRERCLQVRTPDEDVNSALAWSEAALDQAWVCNPKLGCGIVAGYGPSRDQPRPQYAWFFAGDGLVATNALVSAGEYSRAREELEFIAKYQQPATGMIWHELSQSAGYLDWSKYPYMFVHVDISFDYLSTVARYVAVSGDKVFAADHWSSITEAYRYCRSLVRDSDHLPHIPADKEASDEQHRPADDLGLTAGWMAAAASFADLAKLTGHGQLAADALKESQLTRQAIPNHYWNSAQNFWLDGHTHSGAAIFRHALGPTDLIPENVFSPQQNQALLAQLASSDFRTDWGIREVAASAEDYNPYSYGAGSISAPSSTAAAITFWRVHQSNIAYDLWSGILNWNLFDSPGHIHEVLAGNFYQEQVESVPEQTWSSAGFLHAAIVGMLGLEIDGIEERVDFAPHLPADWSDISIDHVRLPHSQLALKLSQSIDGVDLTIRNEGSAVKFRFQPNLPLGAGIVSADFEGQKADVTAVQTSGDPYAKMEFKAPPGTSHCHIQLSGGVAVINKPYIPKVGDASHGIKLTRVTMSQAKSSQDSSSKATLSVDAEVISVVNASFQIRTPLKILAVTGAEIKPLSDVLYNVVMEPAAAETGMKVNQAGYSPAHAQIIFE